MNVLAERTGAGIVTTAFSMACRFSGSNRLLPANEHSRASY